VVAISLAAALVVGVAIVGMSTGQAEAKPRREKDTGVRCALSGVEPGEDITFYLPGEKHERTVGGETSMWTCNSSGLWVP
jgi:hypothetical protein